MTADESGHAPVLVNEVIECMQPHGSGLYIDCTFGRGGYSKEILRHIGQEGRVLALDADPEAIAFGASTFADEPRLVLKHANFYEVADIVKSMGLVNPVQGVVFDLGVSSPQLDDAGRGFSFRNDGPLDMRMNMETGMNAQEWVNSADQAEIHRVIKRYGEEPFAGRIADRLVRSRKASPIHTTRELADLVYQSIPAKERNKRKVHPATKVFQAIRMHINNELENIEKGLSAAEGVLEPGATMAVVSFHSLEDRMVKRFFRELVEGAAVPDKVPLKEKELGGNYQYACKLIKPGDEEIAQNPRSRSARLRAVRRLQ